MIEWYSSNLILIQSAFVTALLALSIQIPMRMGVFSLAGIGFYGIGSYVSAILILKLHLPLVVAILLGITAAAAIGLLLGLLLQRLNGLAMGMATIAFDLILGVIIVNGGEITGGSIGLFGVVVNFPFLALVIITIIILAAVAWSERGRLGRRIDALHEDPQLARTMGIGVARYRVMSFVVAGAIGAVAGSAHVLLRTTTNPTDLGFQQTVAVLTIIIVGGYRSWIGVVIGTLIFTWLPFILSTVGDWRTAIYGIIVTLAAVWLPGGIVGAATDLIRRLRARRTKVAVPETTERSEEILVFSSDDTVGTR